MLVFVLRLCPAECVQVRTKLSDVNHAEAVLSVLRARQEEIRHALLDRTNSISSATLQDFDWQLKVYSSELISFLFVCLKSLITFYNNRINQRIEHRL